MLQLCLSRQLTHNCLPLDPISGHPAGSPPHLYHKTPFSKHKPDPIPRDQASGAFLGPEGKPEPFLAFLATHWALPSTPSLPHPGCLCPTSSHPLCYPSTPGRSPAGPPPAGQGPCTPSRKLTCVIACFRRAFLFIWLSVAPIRAGNRAPWKPDAQHCLHRTTVQMSQRQAPPEAGDKGLR